MILRLSSVLVCYLVLMLNLANCDEDRRTFKLFCYLGSWANYRYGNGKFLIENIDPFLCTHLVYGFAKLDNNRIKPYDPYLDLKDNWGLGAYKRFNALKLKNPNLRTLIAIGGWNEGSVKYSKMSGNSTTRKEFVESCVQFIRKYGFDGLDMDWEYPTQRGGALADKNNFVLLLKELKEAFKQDGFLLTAAVSAGQATIDAAYDIPEVSRYLDFINVMTYDFHGGWDSVTGHNSPLYPRPDESEELKKLNTDYAIRLWLNRGAPANKVILGMPLYGRTFTLQKPQQHGLGVKITGKGAAGKFTRESGFLGYNEICEMVNPEKGWTVLFEEHHKVPYAFKDRLWIGYDDKNSIALKVDYIKNMNLAGGMVWSIETDDFRGLCSGDPYPLLNTIKSGLETERRNDSSLTSPTTTIKPKSPTTEPTLPKYTPSSNRTTRNHDGSPTTTTNPKPKSPTTEPTLPKYTPSSNRTTRNHDSSPTTESNLISGSKTPKDTSSEEPKTPIFPHKVCTDEEGYFRDPTNCKRFFYCMRFDNLGFIAHEFNCGPGTVFSQTIQTCAFPSQVPECEK